MSLSSLKSRLEKYWPLEKADDEIIKSLKDRGIVTTAKTFEGLALILLRFLFDELQNYTFVQTDPNKTNARKKKRTVNNVRTDGRDVSSTPWDCWVSRWLTDKPGSDKHESPASMAIQRTLPENASVRKQVEQTTLHTLASIVVGQSVEHHSQVPTTDASFRGSQVLSLQTAHGIQLSDGKNGQIYKRSTSSEQPPQGREMYTTTWAPINSRALAPPASASDSTESSLLGPPLAHLSAFSSSPPRPPSPNSVSREIDATEASYGRQKKLVACLNCQREGQLPNPGHCMHALINATDIRMEALNQPNGLPSLRHDTAQQNLDGVIAWDEFLCLSDNESVDGGCRHYFMNVDSGIRDLINQARNMTLDAMPSPLAVDYLLRNGDRIDASSEAYHALSSKCRASELPWPIDLTDPVNTVIHSVVSPFHLHRTQIY